MTTPAYQIKRTRLLAIGLLVIGAIFIVRLFWLQVVQYGYYKELANQEQITKFTLPAERGVIYVRDGDTIKPIVLNEASYLAYADPQTVTDKAAVVAAVKEIIGADAVDGFEKRLDNKKLRYTVLGKSLSKAQAEAFKKKDLAGVGFTPGERRVYPEGKLAGQLLGYVDTEGKGRYGIEGALNKELSGTPGELKAVTDVRQIPLTISDQYVNTPAKDGQDLVLSVDRNIQAYAEDALKRGLDRVKATKGSIVVMNPNNGQIMAMANYPDYNPADYAKTEDYGLFSNRAVSEPYEPGSVIKTFTMGAGLDSGAVTVNSVFDDSTGCVQVEDREICNVEEDPKTSRATMLDVLHYSLNTGVVFIEKQMGGGQINEKARQTLYKYFHDKYRFGTATGVEQAGEQPGQINGPNEGYGLNVRYANMSFGQGVQITTLQSAAAFSATINGGNYYQPTLISGTLQKDGTVKEKQPKILASNVLRPEISQQLRDMIFEARQKGILGGDDLEGYRVGGKTGTAEVIDPKTGEYSSENSIGTYLGFGGGKTPQYVIMVKVDDAKLSGGYEGTIAAGPIFGDMSNWLLQYLRVSRSQ